MAQDKPPATPRQTSDGSGNAQEHATLRPDTGPREDKPERTLGNHPADPSSVNSKTFPPGVDAKDAMDPGRQTPGAPPVQNDSGKQ